MKIKRQTEAAYTMVELLVVIAIMGLLVFVGFGGANMNDAGSFANSSAILARAFDQARTYAMANHTYVLVSLTEISSDSSFIPIQQLTSGNGCVVIELVAAEDGSNDSARTNSGDPNLLSVCQPYVLKNLHLLDLSSQTGGKMDRPSGTSLTSNFPSSCAPTPSTWPLGSFNGIFVSFDPEGAAHTVSSLSSSITADPVTPFIEIGIEESRGSQIPSIVTNLNYGALQIEGVSGVNHLYQP